MASYLKFKAAEQGHCPVSPTLQQLTNIYLHLVFARLRGGIDVTMLAVNCCLSALQQICRRHSRPEEVAKKNHPSDPPRHRCRDNLRLIQRHAHFPEQRHDLVLESDRILIVIEHHHEETVHASVVEDFQLLGHVFLSTDHG
ncbi:MAG: hypothetical protein ACI9BW_001460 [Gammaproteobacteria bacterium]|jgi:hypothetical protein